MKFCARGALLQHIAGLVVLPFANSAMAFLGTPNLLSRVNAYNLRPHSRFRRESCLVFKVRRRNDSKVRARQAAKKCEVWFYKRLSG